MDTAPVSPRPGIEAVVIPRTTDLGAGFTVRRALPSAQRRMVGPFVFLDQMGPALLRAGSGLDVRPHPHIGLATVTYLFDGEIMHRDSLGSVQPIRPGELNWMTAGRGIVHSERTPPEPRARGSSLFGIQVWVALPKAHEEAAPSFAHHDAAALPLLADAGFEARLIVGSLGGVRAPVAVFSEMIYLDLKLEAGGRFGFAAGHVERAAYLVEGRIGVGVAGAAAVFGPEQLLVFQPGCEVVFDAPAGPARVLLFGGEPMDGPRHLWWNFVSSSTERIEQAKADWKAGRFAAVPEETEFIPLPETPSQPVNHP
ncbi:MAG TPA: pirin family protein [Caldimonas sp.]